MIEKCSDPLVTFISKTDPKLLGPIRQCSNHFRQVIPKPEYIRENFYFSARKGQRFSSLKLLEIEKELENQAPTKISSLKLAGLVDKDTIESIQRICPELEILDCSDCHIRSEAIAKMGELKKLRILDLSRCQKLSDEDVTVLSQNCHELRSINLQVCSLITDRAVMSLIQNCRKLLLVNLDFCYRVTHVGCSALGTRRS